jgi:uncharacterized protein YdhG (YjbR/CyaY superfamily)
MRTKFNSIDEYIAAFPENVQRILIELRNTIKAAAPEAGEKISYDIPTFTLNGTYLIYFAGWKHHISIYPIPKGNDIFNDKTTKYVAGKGTLKFQLDKPLPLDLISEAVRLRVAENQLSAESKPGR